MTMRRSVLAALAAGLAMLAAPRPLRRRDRVAVAAPISPSRQGDRRQIRGQDRAQGQLELRPSGSSTQIANGAPFEVFLSADTGGAEAETTVSRARHALHLCDGPPGPVEQDARAGRRRGAVLSKGTFQKIAIADPKAAPMAWPPSETQEARPYDRLTPKLVTTSITQAYQFIDTGAAELGFVAFR